MQSYAQILAKATVDALTAAFARTTVRPVTVHLIVHLLFDVAPPPAQRDDFGVRTGSHFRALRAMLDTEAGKDLVEVGEELDQAMGNGPALTALVRKYAPEFASVRFKTSWDELPAK